MFVRYLAVLVMAIVSSAALAERLVITGSSTVAPLVLEMAKRYEVANPGTRIDVQTGGSSRGIRDARMGAADIGMVSRALTQRESDLSGYVIALDGIGMVVHKSNPVTSLTDDQVVAIYRGEIKNWQEVGGLDQEISVVNKAEGRSTLELFLKHFKLRNSQIKAQVIIGDNQQGIKTIAGNPGAIGYVSIGAAEYEETRGTDIKRLLMAGVEASVASVKSGDFPLSRPLSIVVGKRQSDLSRDFITFCQSTEVDDLINAQYFVVPERQLAVEL